MKKIFMLLVFSLMVVNTVSADSVTIYPAWEDWTTQQDPTNPGQSVSNYGYIATQVSPGVGKSRLYIEFNTSKIPVGATITSATLTLNDNAGSFSSSPRNYRIYYLGENITNGDYDDDGAGPYITWNNPPTSCQLEHYHHTGVTDTGDETISITELVNKTYSNDTTLWDNCKGGDINWDGFAGLVIQDNVETKNNNYKNYFMQYNLGAESAGVPYITVVYTLAGGNITNSSLDPQDSSPTYLSTTSSYDHCVQFLGDYNFPTYEIWWSSTSNGSTKDQLLKTGSASASDITCVSFAPPLNLDVDYSIIFNGTNSEGDSFEEYVNYIFEGEGAYWEIEIEIRDSQTNETIEGSIVDIASGSLNFAGESQGVSEGSYTVQGDTQVVTGSNGIAKLYLIPLATYYNVWISSDGYETKLSGLDISGSGTHTFYIVPDGWEYNTSGSFINKSEVPSDEQTASDVKDLIKILAPLMVLGFGYRILFG